MIDFIMIMGEGFFLLLGLICFLVQSVYIIFDSIRDYRRERND